MRNSLFLIRGLPGSGKSTLAEKLARHIPARVREADKFFMHNGEYKYDATKIREAHRVCQEQVHNDLSQGFDSIVANTFVRLWELQPYLQMASLFDAKVYIMTCTGDYKNVHGVPDEVIRRMRRNWEV